MVPQIFHQKCLTSVFKHFTMGFVDLGRSRLILGICPNDHPVCSYRVDFSGGRNLSRHGVVGARHHRSLASIVKGDVSQLIWGSGNLQHPTCLFAFLFVFNL